MEDLEFKEAITAKRHKELLQALKAIFDKLSQVPPVPDNTPINKDLIKILSSLESSIKTPKFTMDEGAIVKEIKNLSKTWISSLDKLKLVENDDDDQEWTFTIQRDHRGLIASVDAKKN